VVICDLVDPEDSDSVDRIEIPISIGEVLELDEGKEKVGAHDSRPGLRDHQRKIRVLELDFGRWSCLSNVSIPREKGERERDDTLRSVSTYNHLASYCSISLCLAHASLTPHSRQNIL